MKKWIALLLLLVGTQAYADPATVAKSSFTQGNETAYITTSTYLDKVVVGATSANGVLVIYNSTWSTTGAVVSSISLATVGTYHYDNVQLQGIYYKINNNSAGVTIIYRK